MTDELAENCQGRPSARAETLMAVLAVLTFVLLSNAFTGVFLTEEMRQQTLESGNTFNAVTFPAVVIIFCLLNLKMGGLPTSSIKAGSFILPLFGMVLVSFIWSAAPGLSARRTISFILSMAFALSLAAWLPLPKLLYFFRLFFKIVIVANVVVLSLPDISIEAGINSGAFRGIFNQKNVLGILLGFSLLLFLGAPREEEPRKYWWLLLAAIQLGFSQSKASVGIALFCVAFMGYTYSRFRIVRLLTFIAITFYVLLFLWLDPLSIGVLDELDLTGRIPLWSNLLEMLNGREWFGYGYGAFWDPSSHRIQLLWEMLAWVPVNSHNGYVDVLLQLGWIGIAFLGFALVFGIINIARIGHKDLLSSTVALALVLYIVLTNFFESNILGQRSFFWVVLVSLLTASSAPSSSDVSRSRT